MITNFRIGKGIGIVSDATIALFEPLNGELAESLWGMVGAGAGIDELLEELSRTGLRSLGSFALAQFEDSETRIVVRGSASARVNGPSGVRELSARGVRTWVEEVVQDVSELDLALNGYEDIPLPFRLDSGLVPADLLHRGELKSPQLADLSVHWVDEFRSEDAVLASPSPLPSPLPSSVPSEAPSTTIEEDPSRTRTVEEALPVDDGDSAPVVAVIPADDVDEYDAIYGRTVARSVQSAAVSTAAAEAPAAVLAAESSPAAGGRSKATDKQADESRPSTPLIQGVPNNGGSASVPPLGDHDGRTMTKAQIKAMRAAQGGSAGSPVGTMGGPTVQALLCPSQHTNPPQLSGCRMCGAPLGTTTVLIARPPLGTLRFGEGTVVTLDHPALIGRNPKVDGAIPNEMPKLVRIDVGQGLSRTHALVRLEGWQVLLEDLNSPNGTIVRLPGREPRRLHAGEPIILEPGSHIDFGGEVDCTLEP